MGNAALALQSRGEDHPRRFARAAADRPRPRFAPGQSGRPVLQRCACGGGCPGCRAAAAAPELPVNLPGDVWEREADRAADAVMAGGHGGVAGRAGGPALRRCSCGGTCPACRARRQAQESALQRDGGAAAVPPGTAPPIVHDVLASSGRPLPPSTRAFMEPRFGADFGRVRVHDDARAAESARAVDAHAYTVGYHLVFGAGRFNPGTQGGDRLLAHELAHVVQQGGGAGGLSRAGRSVFRMSVRDEDGASADPAPGLGSEEAARLGREALATVGYDELIRRAREAGLLPPAGGRPRTPPPARPASTSGGAAPRMVQRQGGAETFWGVMARYGGAAAVSSQLDSPAPGPGDVVALGILVVGLGVAAYTVLSRPACAPCPPNPPPEIDRVPPSDQHWPCPDDHWHYRVYNQNPVTCQCFLSGRLFGGCCGVPGAPC